MASDPKPDKSVRNFDRERAITLPYSDRPIAADLFEMKRRVT